MIEEKKKEARVRLVDILLDVERVIPPKTYDDELSALAVIVNELKQSGKWDQ